MKNSMRMILMALIGAFLATACNDFTPVPKPRLYPRVFYPEKQYESFTTGFCPMTFEKPVYTRFERDTTFFDERAKSDCWFNLSAPSLNARIHCSYYPVGSKAQYDELVNDAFVMVQKHNIKASYIEEIPFSRPADRVYGMVFSIEGPAASSYQFYLTDSTRHFLRGALYFDTQARPDSLAPVVEFMKKDVNHLIETVKWSD